MARLLPASLVLAAAIIVYRASKKDPQGQAFQQLPAPSRFYGLAIVFSLLAGLALLSEDLAGAFGLAVLVSVALGVLPGSGTNQATAGTATSKRGAPNPS